MGGRGHGCTYGWFLPMYVWQKTTKFYKAIIFQLKFFLKTGNSCRVNPSNSCIQIKVSTQSTFGNCVPFKSFLKIVLKKAEAFSFLPLSVITEDLSYMFLFCWGIFYLYLPCCVFIINGCWVLSYAFALFIEIVIWFFPFISLMRYITVIDSQTLHHSCISGINSTWLWCIIL